MTDSDAEDTKPPEVLAQTNVTCDSSKGLLRLWVPRSVIEDAELERGDTVFWVRSNSGKIVGVPASQIAIEGAVP